MDNATYKRGVFRTLSQKSAKVGLRTMARKRATLDVGHALVGVSTEVGEIHQALGVYLQGFQLTSHLRDAARSEFGDLLYYTTVAAKYLKLRLPSSTKKLRLKGVTITQALLYLHSQSTDLLSLYKKVYYDAPLDMTEIKVQLEAMVAILWPLIFEIYEVTPSVLMAENGMKLMKRYPEGLFDTTAALNQVDKES